MNATAFMRMGKVKGPRGVLEATQHNLREIPAGPRDHIDASRSELNFVLRGPSIVKAVAHPCVGEHERLLRGAQALATRLPCLGMTPDLAALHLDDLRGAYRFLQRAAGGTSR